MHETCGKWRKAATERPKKNDKEGEKENYIMQETWCMCVCVV